jgi:hypothetical protein
MGRYVVLGYTTVKSQEHHQMWVTPLMEYEEVLKKLKEWLGFARIDIYKKIG